MFEPGPTEPPPPGMVASWHAPSQVPPGPPSMGDPRTAEPKDAPADWAYSAVLFVVALAPRLFVALAFAKEPVWDGHYYHFGATRIAEGLGYSEDIVVDGLTVAKPWAHYPVGYSALLSVFYRLFGGGILTAPIVNAFLGAGLSVVVHRFARYLLNQNRARIAGALCALHPGLIAYSAVVMTEPLAALLLLASGWSALRLRAARYGFVATGVLVGLGALVRPATLLALPAFFLIGPRPFYKTASRTVLTGLVALLIVSPWTARNCRVMDDCALISTNGGWNLAIGALTETGRFRSLRADDGCPVVTGQVQQDRCWAEVGWALIREDPAAWLGKMPTKLAQTYDHESFPVEYLREANPEAWPEPRRKAGHQLLTFYHFALMALASLSPITLLTAVRRRVGAATQGLLLVCTAAYISYCVADPEHPFFALILILPFIAFLPFPGRPTLGPAGRYLYAVLLVTSLTHAIFFGEDRYHLVVSPVLCILAAGALRFGTVAARRVSGGPVGQPGT